MPDPLDALSAVGEYDPTGAVDAVEGAARSLLGRHITHEFSSEAIASIDWDPESLDLRIVFVGGRGGGEYVFPGVPESVVRGFIDAGSAGSYYNAQIRGRY